MPLAFPSHQGLILPLWRRFPRHIDGVALSVGAAMPDIVDACAWPFRSGELGQWMGHSLLGVLVCVPFGLALTWVVRRVTPRRFIERLESGAVDSGVDSGRSIAPRPGRDAWSVAIGALSHVLFDLVTHAHFAILWPFYTSDTFFPAWWTRPFGFVHLPVYREPYPLAVHTIVWAIASILGIVLFFRLTRRPVLLHGRARDPRGSP